MHGIDTIACLVFFPYHRSILKSQGSTKHNSYTIIAQYESHMNPRGWAFITITGTIYIFIFDYINLIDHVYGCVWTSDRSINWYSVIKLLQNILTGIYFRMIVLNNGMNYFSDMVRFTILTDTSVSAHELHIFCLIRLSIKDCEPPIFNYVTRLT